MAQIGFIRNKQEIKFLILYIAERLIEAVPFEVMQELAMCDPGVGFFEFSESMSYLVDTGHLTCSADGLYAITEKGLQNGRACAEEIPYSVRLNAEKLTEEQNQRIRRSRQVRSSIRRRSDGTFDVELSFNDDAGTPLWHMQLALPDEAKAKGLADRFKKDPEGLYFSLIGMLFPEEKKQEKTADTDEK